MTKKLVSTLLLSSMLLVGATLCVNASENMNQKEARAANSWSVSSYPSGDSSDQASDIRDGGSSVDIFTFSYSSQPSGSQPVYASSPQSPDQVGINSTNIRSLGYSGGLSPSARIDVNFYAYSSTDRIMANGTIEAY